MPRALPPLNPLRSFEAAARHVSFTRAAEELGVTATAVSRQVAVLEGFLDRPLFERRNSELTLTATGMLYLSEVQPALEKIVAATSHVRRRPRTRLFIRCERSLALHWLAPRLARFRQLRPELAVELSTRPADGGAELGEDEVWIGGASASGADVTRLFLFEDRIAPVCAPAIMESRAAPCAPADLLTHPLLATLDQWQAWSDWLGAAGVIGRPQPAIGFDDDNLLFDAARRGLGFALAPLELIADMLVEGQLIAPFAAVMRGPGYHLAYRRSRGSTLARDFALWLAEETRRDLSVTETALGRAA